MQGNRNALDNRLTVAESRYRLLVDAITDYAIYMLDVNGFVSSWNAGAERFKGYREEEILGSHFSRFYTPEDRAVGLPDRALQIAEREGRFENEGWRMRKDGVRFWANVVIDPIRTPDGKLVGFAKITRDLTEKRKIEADLRLSESQFQILVNGVTDYAIYMLDLGGEITSWNSGAERIKGYRREEVLGTNFSRFYTPEDTSTGAPLKALETASRTGRYETEGWRVRKDGTRFWASVVIDALRDETRSIIGFAKITRDITEKREARKALDQAREELFQAQKMEAIGRLTGGIAHDFNNLLMAITGSLELLKRHLPDDPKASRLIRNALEGAERGAALTRQMLAFSRKQELDLERVDLVRLVEDMVTLIERTIGPTISVETDLPPDLPAVRSDANQLASALLNLALNARDAMPAGGRLRISARRVAPDEERPAVLARHPVSHVRLSVSDDGHGMDAATLGRAVTPFFTTKEIGKGTGLGLSMVQGFLDQSGGALVLRSQPGRGTRADLWIPVDMSVEELEKRERSPTLKATGEARRLHILVVDDDPLVLMSTALMLEELGHRVIQTCSSEKARDILASGERIDLLVSDQAMPKVTGLELIAAGRRMRPALPAIIVTGYSDLAGRAPDHVRLLPKPYREQDLAEALEALAPHHA